jgi:hypothetical protein
MSSTGTTSKSTTTSGAAPKPAASTPDPSMTGLPSVEVVTVESDEKNPGGAPMVGINAVAVQVGCDGFGNWRALNLGDAAPAFKTRDECLTWVTTTGIPGGTVVS